VVAPEYSGATTYSAPSVAQVGGYLEVVAHHAPPNSPSRSSLAANQSGGACVPYGASISRFRDDLARFRSQWLTAVYACRATG
jgi:hypothetical protein